MYAILACTEKLHFAANGRYNYAYIDGHIKIVCSRSDNVVAITMSLLVMKESYWAARVMLHLLPGGKLKKVTDVLELVVVVTNGASSESLQISVQMLVGM